MPKFIETINPTPFQFFDADQSFQLDADGMVLFVKRKLGDDVLSVELSNKEIWSCFEEATCEYSRLIHEMKIQSELVNVLGLPTGSTNLTNMYPRQSLEYLIRMAEPYANESFVGGTQNPVVGAINLEWGRQDYDLYNELKHTSGSLTGTLIWDTIPNERKTKYKIVEIFHFEPTAAQQTLLNASNITNFLATNFNYESYVNSTVFYVLPVFEDVLRRGMLESAFRVRRSHYSYELQGSKLRIYPVPTSEYQLGKLFVKIIDRQTDVLGSQFGASGSVGDASVYGISGPSNVPLDNIPYTTITQPGRQWIRQYTLALCKELLGLIRSKYDSIPIPNGDVKLNGDTLRSDGRDDQKLLKEQMKAWLENLTNQKLQEQQALLAESVNKQLKYVPMPLGKAIFIG